MRSQKHFYAGNGDGAGDIRKRLWLLSFCVLVFFAVIALRLWYLQVVRGKYYRELSEENRVRIISIRPPRGAGTPIAGCSPKCRG